MAEALDIAHKTYLASLMDQTCNGPVVVGSPMGGMHIEEVAEKNSNAIYNVQAVLYCAMFCLSKLVL